MEGWSGGGRGGRGVGRRSGGGHRRDADGRRGFWVSLRDKDRGAVVQEGIDFAQDLDEGGGDDCLFISDSEDEISDEFMVAPDSGGSFLHDTEEQAPSMVVAYSPGSFIFETEYWPLNVVEEQLVLQYSMEPHLVVLNFIFSSG